MAVTTNKALLFVGGGIAAAAIVAYAAGAFNPRIEKTPETIAALPETDQAGSRDASPPEGQPPAVALQTPAEESAAPEAPTPAPEAGAPAGTEPVVVPPSFDVVRVEGNGSIVIAGKAAPNAKVDLLVGSNEIGSAKADAGGDFAVVLDDPLKPGDYQIVLRATAPGNVVAMSIETAVVSVPETAEGQVLALVEEPGKPSQMITLPQPQAPAAAAKPPAAAAPPAAEAPPAVEIPAAPEPKPEGEMQAALPEQAEPAPPPAGPAVRVEAVEIDGRKIFVAGVADPGRTVRGYANEILLGDAKASPDGRYLIEADRDLPVGDYIIRVDALEQDGVKVAARAAVPFEREPGETIAAVAPPAPEPATPSASATQRAAAKPTTEAPVGAVAPPAEAPPAEPPAAVPSAEAPAVTTSTGAPPAVAEAPAATPEQPAQPPPATAEAPAAAANSPATEPPAAVVEAPAAQSAESAPNPPAINTPPAAAPGSQLAAEQRGASATSTGTSPVPETPAASPSAAAAPALPPSGAETPVSPPAVAEAPAVRSPAAETSAPQAPAITPPSGETETHVAAAPAQQLPAPPSADGVSEVLAPKLQSVDSAVIIRRGDTLWRISRRVYGRGVRYSTIYLANEKQIEDPDRIWPGQVFKVPEKSNDGKAEADYSTLGESLTTVPKEGEAGPAEGPQ